MVRVEWFCRELLAFLYAVLPLWCIKNYHNVHDFNFNGFIHVHTHKRLRWNKKKVIYFNMHHTSTCVLLLLVDLPFVYIWERTATLMHLFKKQQQKNSLACKKMEIRIPDNALEKTLISAEGRAFFFVAFQETKQIKNENGFVFAPIFPSLFAFNVCNIKKRIDFYVSGNVRKKDGQSSKNESNKW